MSNFTETPLRIDVDQAYQNIFADTDVRSTTIHKDQYLSQLFDADILLVSELGQHTGAYKIRGATNWYAQNVNSNVEEVVAFSAGNHAAAVAACARSYGVRASIFMPEATPEFKVDLVRELGGSGVNIMLGGQTVDDAAGKGKKYLDERGSQAAFIHPFDDELVVSGQGTLGREIDEIIPDVDIIVAPVGGGGLLSGIIHATRHHNIDYVAVEPSGAASLAHNLEMPEKSLEMIDTFVDGAAVKQVGSLILNTLAEVGNRYTLVQASNQAVREQVTRMWQDSQGLRPELAGALSVAALREVKSLIKGKTVACVVTGGNLSHERYEREVKLR